MFIKILIAIFFLDWQNKLFIIGKQNVVCSYYGIFCSYKKNYFLDIDNKFCNLFLRKKIETYLKIKCIYVSMNRHITFVKNNDIK